MILLLVGIGALLLTIAFSIQLIYGMYDPDPDNPEQDIYVLSFAIAGWVCFILSGLYKLWILLLK